MRDHRGMEHQRPSGWCPDGRRGRLACAPGRRPGRAPTTFTLGSLLSASDSGVQRRSPSSAPTTALPAASAVPACGGRGARSAAAARRPATRRRAGRRAWRRWSSRGTPRCPPPPHARAARRRARSAAQLLGLGARAPRTDVVGEHADHARAPRRVPSTRRRAVARGTRTLTHRAAQDTTVATQKAGRPQGDPRMNKRRRPTLPGPCGPSTIGAERLNFSVRNGKRCFPLAIATEIGARTAARSRRYVDRGALAGP